MAEENREENKQGTFVERFTSSVRDFTDKVDKVVDFKPLLDEFNYWEDHLKTSQEKPIRKLESTRNTLTSIACLHMLLGLLIMFYFLVNMIHNLTTKKHEHEEESTMTTGRYYLISFIIRFG